MLLLSISAASGSPILVTGSGSENDSTKVRRLDISDATTSFRVGQVDSSSTASFDSDCDSNSDLVHIPSNAILKHALLGKLAEDNADLKERSIIFNCTPLQFQQRLVLITVVELYKILHLICINYGYIRIISTAEETVTVPSWVPSRYLT